MVRHTNCPAIHSIKGTDIATNVVATNFELFVGDKGSLSSRLSPSPHVSLQSRMPPHCHLLLCDLAEQSVFLLSLQ